MNNNALNSLRNTLGSLAETGGLAALKTGTEVEDMCFSDISIMKELSRDILPLYVKIGGPEARNDMRELHLLGVDGIIAPMIESAYGLKNFIISMKQVLGPIGYERMEKGINMETITCFTNMNSILASPYARELDQITAARTDLSGSMDLAPDNERVLEICSVMIARARENDLRTSVGGAIHPGIIRKIIESVNPDTINTRHMVMNCKALEKAPEEMVVRNLQFEVDFYEYLATLPGIRQKLNSDRASVIRKRIKNSAVQAGAVT